MLRFRGAGGGVVAVEVVEVPAAAPPDQPLLAAVCLGYCCLHGWQLQVCPLHAAHCLPPPLQTMLAQLQQQLPSQVGR